MSPQSPRGVVARAARWVRSRRRLVVFAWLAAALAAMAAAPSAGTRYGNNLSLPWTDSQRATDLLQRQFPL